MAYPQGDTLARAVAARIGAAVATTAALIALPAEAVADGSIFLVTADGSIWTFASGSTVTASADALTPTYASGMFLRVGAPPAGPRVVRGVCTSNMSLSAFVGVTGGTAQDGVTYVIGDRVLLAGQTTAAQNGIYVVGTVAAGTAPLTRAPDFFTGATVVNGCVVEVSEGTVWRGSSWKAMATGSVVIGTTDPAFYPRQFRKTVTLSSGTYVIGAGGGSEALYLYSTTTSSVQATRNTAGGTLTATTHYFCPVAGRTAGKAGTAAVTVTASVAAGTVNTADTSTVDVLVSNW
jgi:hypothetical protein